VFQIQPQSWKDNSYHNKNSKTEVSTHNARDQYFVPYLNLGCSSLHFQDWCLHAGKIPNNCGFFYLKVALYSCTIVRVLRTKAQEDLWKELSIHFKELGIFAFYKKIQLYLLSDQ